MIRHSFTSIVAALVCMLFVARYVDAAAIAPGNLRLGSTSGVASPIEFQALPPVNIGNGVTSVATGDFDRDGKIDVAVASYGSVSVMLGNGDGTFKPAVPYAVDGYVQSVAVADMNRDGKPDLVVSSWIGSANGPISSVAVFLGNGDGTFQSPITYSISLPPNLSAMEAAAGPLVVGDFNGDDIPDVAVDIDNGSSLNPVAYILALTGNGDGSLSASGLFPSGTGATAVALGDFNRDGALDLAISSAGCGNQHCYDATVSILIGNGDGSFRPAVSYQTSTPPYAMAVADLSNDGISDIVTVGHSYNEFTGFAQSFDVLVGMGDGTFAPAQSTPVSYFPTTLAVADFDRDGKYDLAVGQLSDLTFLQGIGNFSFQPSTSFPTGPNQQIDNIAVTDLNHDDKPDLILGDAASGNITVLLNLTGDRIFSNGFEL